MAKDPTTKPDASPQPLELDRLIHEPARLKLISVLYVLESADFIFLRQQTGLTHGNLSTHMSRLEEAGYVEIKKEFVGKKPHTLYLLTKPGREAFVRYRDELNNMLNPHPPTT